MIFAHVVNLLAGQEPVSLKEKLPLDTTKIESNANNCMLVWVNASYSKTDHDATLVRANVAFMKNDLLKPRYNLQISTNSLQSTEMQSFDEKVYYRDVAESGRLS